MNKFKLVAFVSSTLLFGCLTSKGEDEACATYCDVMESACPNTGFVGGSTEHDRDECLDACDDYDASPVFDEDGTEVPLGDRVPDSDTLACRVYHADNATGDPGGVHCSHASPDGGGTCVQFKELCDQFCVGAPADPGGGVRPDGFPGVVEYCSSTPDGPTFESSDDCAAHCNGLTKGNPDDVAGRTRYCHLNRALDLFEQMDQTRCSEIGPESAFCGGI